MLSIAATAGIAFANAPEGWPDNTQTQPQEQVIQTISVAMEDIPLDKMAKKAEFIIVGEVIKVKSKVFTDNDRANDKKNQNVEGIVIIDKEVLSKIKIRVQEDLLGNYNQHTISVVIPGGETPSLKTIHEASPELQVGDRAIFFIGKGDSYSISDQDYTILAMNQGTVKLGDKVVSKYADDKETEQSMKQKIISERGN